MGRYHGLKALIQNNPGEPGSDPSLEWNPLSRATCLELGRRKKYLTFFYHYEFTLYENFTVGCIIFVTVVMCTLAFIVQADTKICKQARGAAEFFFSHQKKMFSQICENM